MTYGDIWQNENTWTAKNGVRFKRYEDLPEGDPVKQQLRPENNASVIIGDFRYVFRIHNGSRLVFQNPIKSTNNTRPPSRPDQSQSNNDRPHQPQQQQVVLSLQHIEWIRQTSEVAKRIEKLLTDSAPSE